MMVEILDPKEGETIYDPACGTGSMLLASIDHEKRHDGDLISPLWAVTLSLYCSFFGRRRSASGH